MKKIILCLVIQSAMTFAYVPTKRAINQLFTPGILLQSFKATPENQKLLKIVGGLLECCLKADIMTRGRVDIDFITMKNSDAHIRILNLCSRKDVNFSRKQDNTRFFLSSNYPDFQTSMSVERPDGKKLIFFSTLFFTDKELKTERGGIVIDTSPDNYKKFATIFDENFNKFKN